MSLLPNEVKTAPREAMVGSIRPANEAHREAHIANWRGDRVFQYRIDGLAQMTVALGWPWWGM